jgi:hypothetical protein
MKVVRLKNWRMVLRGPVDPFTPPECIPRVLCGNAFGHPKFPDGTEIMSTRPVKVEGRKITTRNTIYILGNIEKEYRKYLKKERPNWNWRKPITMIGG